jgi:Protein of unknown function (DUF4089)
MSPTNEAPQASQRPLDMFGLLNLMLPSECVAGVEANIEIMKVHARIVEGFDLTKAKPKAVDE